MVPGLIHLSVVKSNEIKLFLSTPSSSLTHITLKTDYTFKQNLLKFNSYSYVFYLKSVTPYLILIEYILTLIIRISKYSKFSQLSDNYRYMFIYFLMLVNRSPII